VPEGDGLNQNQFFHLLRSIASNSWELSCGISEWQRFLPLSCPCSTAKFSVIFTAGRLWNTGSFCGRGRWQQLGIHICQWGSGKAALRIVHCSSPGPQRMFFLSWGPLCCREWSAGLFYWLIFTFRAKAMLQQGGFLHYLIELSLQQSKTPICTTWRGRPWVLRPATWNVPKLDAKAQSWERGFTIYCWFPSRIFAKGSAADAQGTIQSHCRLIAGLTTMSSPFLVRFDGPISPSSAATSPPSLFLSSHEKRKLPGFIWVSFLLLLQFFLGTIPEIYETACRLAAWLSLRTASGSQSGPSPWGTVLLGRTAPALARKLSILEGGLRKCGRWLVPLWDWRAWRWRSGRLVLTGKSIICLHLCCGLRGRVEGGGLWRVDAARSRRKPQKMGF